MNSSELASSKSRGKSSKWILALKILLLFMLFSLAMAIFTPARSEPGTGRRISAKNDTVQIATAFTAYETEYGQLPTTDPETQVVSGPILQALTGSNGKLNPRQIVFLEVPPAKKGKGGIRDGIYVDPWGSPYKVKLDTDYDNKLQNVGPAFNPTAELNKKVAVWNDPDTHSDRPGEKTKTRRAVNSWQ
jgi:hypothetical protein